MKKNLRLYPIVFAIVAGFCFLFLLGVSQIPQEKIQVHAKESAECFMEHSLFDYAVGNLENFKRDNYADCISTGIAYHLGEGDALSAVLGAFYNRVPEENVNVSFYREMSGDEVETENYSRYWHGSAGVIRLLLMGMNVKTMQLVFLVFGMLLNSSVVFVLMRQKQTALGVSYGLAFCLVNGGFALTCLEYAFVFLLMPLFVLILLFFGMKIGEKKIPVFFMIFGMLTAFFDFLTAETLTFTVPFTVYYIAVWRTFSTKKGCYTERKEKKKGFDKKAWMLFLQNGAAWFMGYAGMFLFKWILSAACFGRNTFEETFHSLAERLYGDVGLTLSAAGEKADLWQRLQGIVVRNLGCLYWGSSEMKVTTLFCITIIVVIVLFGFWYLFWQKRNTGNDNLVFIATAVLPSVRFLVLSNHSYIHYFFTYRAWMVTVMIVLYLIVGAAMLKEQE